MTHEQNVAKIVKAFFRAHPRVFIKHHWRMNEIGAAQKEAMLAPRTANVRPREIQFAGALGISYLKFKGYSAAEIDGDLLHLTFEGNEAPAPHLTYQALPRG